MGILKLLVNYMFRKKKFFFKLYFFEMWGNHLILVPQGNAYPGSDQENPYISL